MNDYTLFYNDKDGMMHKGSCREEKERLVDVSVGEAVSIDGLRGEGKNLIFTGFEFITSAEIALVVPDGTTIVLESASSLLKVVPEGPGANTAVIYTKGDMTITGGEGELFCDSTSTTAETTLWSRCICCRYGNLTITGGKITCRSGECSRNGGAYYAGGRLFAEEYGEQENGAITITGGTVRGLARPQAVRATNGKLTIGAGSLVENAVEFSGSEDVFHGDCLTPEDFTSDVIVKFTE